MRVGTVLLGKPVHWHNMGEKKPMTMTIQSVSFDAEKNECFIEKNSFDG